jgi:hypothetical protein
MKLSHIEKFMIVFATIEPIATIPQIIEIWFRHNMVAYHWQRGCFIVLRHVYG